MHDKLKTTLEGKTIASVDVDRSNIKLYFTDGTSFDFDHDYCGNISWHYEEQDVKVCCICGELFEGFGHNPWPYETEGRCCDTCNSNIVVPRRIANFRNSEANTNPSCSTCTHEDEKWNSEACFNCNQDSNYEARK